MSLVACLLALGTLSSAQGERVLLLRSPSVSQTQIVFSFAGDLWVVGRNGGDARRLTSGIGEETDSFFSPDGTQVAFSGEYDGNRDVYVVPAAGGVPKRLTYHPGTDTVAGWTPDGRNILFVSTRASYYHAADQLYTVPAAGGFPAQVPLPIVEQASFSADASHLAYVPHAQWQAAWKRYRGGQTTPIWIASIADSRIERITRQLQRLQPDVGQEHDLLPVGSQRPTVSLFAYDSKTKQVVETIKTTAWTSSPRPRDRSVVIEQFGALKLYDTGTRR
jgi:tricorn protease